MELAYDEIQVWNESCHMIMNGEVVTGDLTITNKRMVFRVDNHSRFGSKKKRNLEDFWELPVGHVHEVNLHEKVGINYPMVRVRYKEDEVFFTFPDHQPRQLATALIVFINHARLIERVMGVMRSLDGSLREGNLQVGERLPHIMIDVPQRADEDCLQCGQPLLDEEFEALSDDIRECISCMRDIDM
jgi:hypothetical protein